MTFNFQWQDPNEMTIYKVLAEGDATFKIDKVEETVSKTSGEEMLKIALSVTDSKGNTGIVDEYIVASQPWKLKNLCWAINRPDIYEQSSDGRLNTVKLIAEKGRCVIKTEKSNNPKYEDRTVITKYIDAVKLAQEQAVQDAIPNDDLPF